MKRILFVCMAGAALLLSGCKSSEDAARKSGRKISEERTHFSEMLANCPDYTSFSAKASVTVTTAGGSIKSRATVRILKDRVLQISIQPLLGIEMGRIQITPDSLFAVDKINRRYLAASLTAYKDMLPFDIRLAAIQALFLDRPFLLDKGELTADDYPRFAYSHSKSQWQLSAGNDGVDYQFVTDETCRIVETSMYTTDLPRCRMLWKYAGFNRQNDVWFPASVNIQFEAPGKSVQVDLSYSTPSWNTLQSLDFSVPAQYRKMEMSDLVKMLFE